MTPRVISVTAQENHQLAVSFSNGESGVLDMNPYLDFGVFARLKDEAEFAKVAVSFDTVEWASGVDLDPTFVYQKCVKYS